MTTPAPPPISSWFSLHDTAFHLHLWDYCPAALDDFEPPPPQGGGEGDPEADPSDGETEAEGGDDETGGEETEAEGESKGEDSEDLEPDNEGEDEIPVSPAPAPGSISDYNPDTSTFPDRDWTSTIIRRGDLLLREFSTYADFVMCAANPRLYRWKHHHESIEHDTRWSGTKNMSEAVSFALYRGWPEGLRAMSEAIDLVITRPEVYTLQTYDVAGAFPLVPLFCAGDPACMMDQGADSRITNPIVSIEIGTSQLAHVSTRDVLLRGAATLSYANHLEALGYSTQIFIVGKWAPNDRGRWRSDVPNFGYRVPFKLAGESWDLDRAAFALANASILRRFGFALVEQHPELESSFSSGYGSALHEPISEDANMPGGTIYIPGSSGRETPDTARSAVLSAILRVMDIDPLLTPLAA